MLCIAKRDTEKILASPMPDTPDNAIHCVVGCRLGSTSLLRKDHDRLTNAFTEFASLVSALRAFRIRLGQPCVQRVPNPNSGRGRLYLADNEVSRVWRAMGGGRPLRLYVVRTTVLDMPGSTCINQDSRLRESQMLHGVVFLLDQVCMERRQFNTSWGR